jgi:hypothetical protein
VSADDGQLLSDTRLHEAVREITIGVIRQPGVWGSRIIYSGNPCGTDLIPENRLWLDRQTQLGTKE